MTTRKATARTRTTARATARARAVVVMVANKGRSEANEGAPLWERPSLMLWVVVGDCLLVVVGFVGEALCEVEAGFPGVRFGDGAVEGEVHELVAQGGID